MLDTVKVGIPLTQDQLNHLLQRSSEDDCWQWVQRLPATGEIRFSRVKGLAQLDRQSYHREIVYYIPDHFILGETHLQIELSLPKFYYGHNIYLLYDFVNALHLLKNQLESQLSIKFVDVLEWQVFRADACYAWKVFSQDLAQQLLDSLKRIHYPRKKPIIYPTSIVFAGNTYSLKFYLKHPEFIQHDRKALLKQNILIENIEFLENLSLGVIRCEATLRRKYLIRQNIKTIGDLAKSKAEVIFDDDCLALNPQLFDSETNVRRAAITIFMHNIKAFGAEYENVRLTNSFSKKTFLYNTEYVYKCPPMTLQIDSEKFIFNGGGCTHKHRTNPTLILQYFIYRFLGDNKGMDTADQVKNKLLTKYKSSKALRLLGFWMHVQKFSSQDAKNLYGKSAFYQAKSDLKEAGVSLVEPPKVINAEERFLESFQFEVPNEYVINRFDENRSHIGVIELFTKDIQES